MSREVRGLCFEDEPANTFFWCGGWSSGEGETGDAGVVGWGEGTVGTEPLGGPGRVEGMASAKAGGLVGGRDPRR